MEGLHIFITSLVLQCLVPWDLNERRIDQGEQLLGAIGARGPLAAREGPTVDPVMSALERSRCSKRAGLRAGKPAAASNPARRRRAGD